MHVHSLCLFVRGVIIKIITSCLCCCGCLVFIVGVVKDGKTALILAAEKENIDMVKFLLERGANTDVVNNVSISLSVSSIILFIVYN